MKRLVIDTNVLVSSLIAVAGPPGVIRRAWEEGRFMWCLSEALYEEYSDVLRRPALRKAFKRAKQDSNEFLEALAGAVDWVDEPLVIASVIEDDPDDDVVLATALAAEADMIVSGDQHLLQLGSYEGIAILSPRDALPELIAV